MNESDKALIGLYELCTKGTGEYKDILSRTSPMDTDIPGDSLRIENFKDGGNERADRLNVKKSILVYLEMSGYIRCFNSVLFSLTNRGKVSAERLLAQQAQTEDS